MPKKYKHVIRVRSMTKREKIYTIKEDEEGKLSCSCGAWIFKMDLDENGERDCKHLRAYRSTDVFTKLQKMAVDGVLEEEDLLRR